MADAYANSIMVDALILGREGTIVVPEYPGPPPGYHYYAPSLPGIDNEEQMERWEPWVRAYTAIGEMLQDINFQAAGNGLQVRSGASLIAEIGRPQKATFEAQIPMVLSWAELRNERATEILAQIDPQYAFWSSIVYMRSDRNKRTFELINMLLQFCVYVEMRFKHAFACWRPVEYNAQVQPMITTPGHGAFPSGHTTQAHAVAYMLKALLKLGPSEPGHAMIIDQLDRQAARIATNRVIAGVHFPVDSMAGRMLGVALGEYFVGRCTGQQPFMSRKFIATEIDTRATTDFNPFSTGSSATTPSQDLNRPPFYSESAGANVTQSPLMNHVWTKAEAEWHGKFGVPVPV